MDSNKKMPLTNYQDNQIGKEPLAKESIEVFNEHSKIITEKLDNIKLIRNRN